MKKILLSLFIFIISINVYASSGSIRQSSVIECDGIYYGSHSNHWHTVKLENGKYVIKDSKELSAPSCYIELENESETVKLSKCVDGDTAKFIMEDGSIKTARFLAIDTPESVHPKKEVEAYGKEASEYTCNLLKSAKSLKVEYDKASEKTDKYGRILVWVYADNKLVQETLLEEGYAKVAYLYANYEYTDHLKSVESTAKSKKLRIWSSDEISNSLSSTDSEDEDVLDSDDSSDDLTDNSILNAIIKLIEEFLTSLFKKIINLID